MFHVRVSTPLPVPPTGKHLSFHCVADDGRVYFCKSDDSGRAIRATEWVATKLAELVGISVAACAIVENEQSGETYFGSRSPQSTAGQFELQAFFDRAASNEFGKPEPWLGRHLARVWAYDILIDNPDRILPNFVLDQDELTGQIRAIDFADAGLLDFSVDRFPAASSPTGYAGRLVRRRYGSHKAAALELLSEVARVPLSAIEGVVRAMPESWLPAGRVEDFLRVWSDGRFEQRISNTKALIEHEWEN